MADTLATNQVIREVDLSHNRIDLTALRPLLEGLKTNTTLKCLKVRGLPSSSGWISGKYIPTLIDVGASENVPKWLQSLKKYRYPRLLRLFVEYLIK